MKAEKLLAALLCIAMIISLLPAAYAEDAGESGDIVYIDFNTEENETPAQEETPPAQEEPSEDPAQEPEDESQEPFEDEQPGTDETEEPSEEDGDELEEPSGDETGEDEDAGDGEEDEEDEEDDIPRQPVTEDEGIEFEASTAGVITNPALVSGSSFTGDAGLAAKLDAVFNGSASIFYDSSCTQPVNTRLGTRSVPNDGNYMYIGRRGQSAVWAATSCWVLANGVYFTLFGEIIVDNDWADKVQAPRSERITQAVGQAVNYSNFVKWGVRNGVGALVRLRMRNAVHSIFILSYDASGVTYIDGNGDSNGLVAVRTVGWGSLSGTVEYIGQPKQSTMNSLYPGDGSTGGGSGSGGETPAPAELPAPVLLSAANYENYIKVSWEPVKGAEMYRLSYRRGTDPWIKVCDTTSTKINVTDVADGETYTFKVECYTKDGKTKVSPESNRIGQMRLTTPSITVKQYGAAGEQGGFRVDWTPTKGGSCYKVYYRQAGGSWVLYAMIPKTANTLFCNIKESVTNSNSGLPNLTVGKTYEFMVLTCTSVASVTSAYPSPFPSLKFTPPEGSGRAGYIDTQTANVRSGPGSQYSIIATVSFGTSVSVLAEPENRYCYVRVNGVTGYVYADFIAYY